MTHGASPRSSKRMASMCGRIDSRPPMRAAVLHEYGATPVVEDVGEPEGELVVDVLAAGLNPIDLRIASGTLAARRPELPSVVGSEGIGRTPDGRRVYFT